MTFHSPDWSRYWQQFDENGAERSAVDAMINWLSAQKPTAWHKFVTAYMNWDCSHDIGLWILNQPNCDRATASVLLFGTSPGSFLDPEVYKNGGIDSDAIVYIKTILENFDRGYYKDSKIEEVYFYDADYGPVLEYQEERKRYAENNLHRAFSIPEQLIGPFSGEAADFPADMSPYVNKEMWALIFALQVDVPNEASEKWRADGKAAKNRWCKERRQANFFVRQFFHPPKIIPFGPDFETEDERTRYINGDKAMSKLVLRRAYRKALKAPRPKGPAYLELKGCRLNVTSLKVLTIAATIGLSLLAAYLESL